MKKIFTHFALLFGAVLFIGAAASSARADIIYLGPRVVQPSGQGVVPTVLTLQENGPAHQRDGFESGGVRRVSSGKKGDENFGDAKNGVNSKTILFSDLRTGAGVQSASDLGIFLDIVEPGNDRQLTIQGTNSLILTAYKDDGTVLDRFFYTGEFRELVVTEGQGGGKSDHVFGLDAVQAARLQALINANADLRLGLEATLGSVFGGPDQFFFGSLGNNTQPIPEPATLLLLGSGLAGVAAKIRKRRRLATEASDEPQEK